MASTKTTKSAKADLSYLEDEKTVKTREENLEPLLLDEFKMLEDIFTSLNADYFSFLRDMVEDKKHKNFMILLSLLHKKHFYSLVKYDENRVDDAKKLREKFVDQLTFRNSSDIGVDWLLQGGAASFLEICIVLAEKMTRLRYDAEDDDHNTMDIRPAFWEILGNLGLTEYTNGSFKSAGIQNMIDEKVDVCLSRTYAKNGVGGLFPMKKPPSDMRKVELAYQIQYYLIECEGGDGYCDS